MIAKCNECPTEPFRVPWDKIGAELMKAHFKEKHPEISIEVWEK